MLASGDGPLVHKHGIAVFQGGHRVKENCRTAMRSEFTDFKTCSNLFKHLICSKHAKHGCVQVCIPGVMFLEQCCLPESVLHTESPAGCFKFGPAERD